VKAVLANQTLTTADISDVLLVGARR